MSEKAMTVVVWTCDLCEITHEQFDEKTLQFQSGWASIRGQRHRSCEALFGHAYELKHVCPDCVERILSLVPSRDLPACEP